MHPARLRFGPLVLTAVGAFIRAISVLIVSLGYTCLHICLYMYISTQKNASEVSVTVVIGVRVIRHLRKKEMGALYVSGSSLLFLPYSPPFSIPIVLLYPSAGVSSGFRRGSSAYCCLSFPFFFICPTILRRYSRTVSAVSAESTVSKVPRTASSFDVLPYSCMALRREPIRP